MSPAKIRKVKIGIPGGPMMKFEAPRFQRCNQSLKRKRKFEPKRFNLDVLEINIKKITPVIYGGHSTLGRVFVKESLFISR
ncbi:MAG: hypothetical protein PHX25_03665 [Candidatus Pacebacteria bacterium]|nr:hypothetical protein [Candidatus Paceibacterota bacterium]